MSPLAPPQPALFDKLQHAMQHLQAGRLDAATLTDAVAREMEALAGMYERTPQRPVWSVWHTALNDYFCALEWMQEALQQDVPWETAAWSEAQKLASSADCQLMAFECEAILQDVA
ncbi:MAG: hypothetical protein ACYCW6_18650 [Candidatus Xenobia bacterium]